MCRFGRQSFHELLGRRPSALEEALFIRALKEILDEEYDSTPPELRHED
jgi:hypothetical protein